MAESDRKFSISWKLTTGYDSPLLNLSADSVAELNKNAAEFITSGLHDRILQVIIDSQRKFKEMRGDVPAQHGQGSGPGPSQDPWASQPGQRETQQDPWASQGAQPDPWANQGQTQPPPQQQQGRGAPNGNPVCQCGQVMEYKTTNSGEGVWRCPSWRWNSGNPTPNHDSEFVNKKR